MAIEVKATQVGYYEGRRRKGDRFAIRSEKDFSAKWMAKVEAKADKKDAKADPKVEAKADKKDAKADPKVEAKADKKDAKADPKVEAKAGDGDQPPPKGGK